MHPRHEVPKVYRARVRGVPDASAIERLSRGIPLDGHRTAPASVRVLKRLDTPRGSDSIVDITLREGRNRQVRRMCEAVGHPVVTLSRVQFGPLRDPGLKVGHSRELTPREVKALQASAMLTTPTPQAKAGLGAPQKRRDGPRTRGVGRAEARAARQPGAERRDARRYSAPAAPTARQKRISSQTSPAVGGRSTSAWVISDVTSRCTGAVPLERARPAARLDRRHDVVVGAVQQEHRRGDRRRDRAGDSAGSSVNALDVRQQDRPERRDVARVDVVHQRARRLRQRRGQRLRVLELERRRPSGRPSPGAGACMFDMIAARSGATCSGGTTCSAVFISVTTTP